MEHNEGNNKTIFLVDDNEMYLEGLRTMINDKYQHKSLDIHCFTSGEECLKNMDKNPRLILLDYYLEDYYQNLRQQNQLTGLEMINRIKNVNIETEVIIMSKERNKETVQRIAKVKEVNTFLSKDDKISKRIDEVIAALID
ncbi:MAG: response regulator [Flavobacteriales bacterium]|nr:response regulator [Flavobacteriales bacterium]